VTFSNWVTGPGRTTSVVLQEVPIIPPKVHSLHRLRRFGVIFLSD